MNARAKIKKTTKKTTKLTEKQELFCQYFVQSLNATQSYKKAYESSYTTAKTEGYKTLAKPCIREKITALKKEKAKSLMLDENDIVEQYMKIAFVDITDYIEFGREKIDVMTMLGPMEVKNEETGETETVQKEINTIRFKEHTEVDGTIISQIKVGKDGASIKLEDRMKALEWLSDYFEINQMNKHRKNYDNKKLEIEKERLELEKIKVNPPEQEVEDDGFVEALNVSAQEDWSDEFDSEN